MKVLYILLCIAFASGFRVDNNETYEGKIVEGDYVGIEDIPYLANLFWFRIENLCGATIIHESWVITAAHCVQNKSYLSVRTGSGYRETSGKLHKIKKIITHDNFEPISRNNDITLIKLTEPIHVNNEQRPIEIAKLHDSPRQGELMRISGFGQIGAAYVPVVNQASCERAYRSHPITDNMFCAGNGNADSCYGDSGGPGIIHGKLYGIISTGIYCESKIFPGVYTRVHKYYDWIKEKSRLKL